MFRKRIHPLAEYADYYDERPRRPVERPQTPVPRGNRRWWLGHVAGLVLATAFCLGLVRLVAGQPMIEKTLKALVAPVGIVWMMLFLITWLCLVRRQAFLAAVAFLAWLILTVAGNSFVAQWLGDSLQRQYAMFDINQAESVGTLLVLGGGTANSPRGVAQGGAAADRIIVAGRMALSGNAETIVCSGTHPLGDLPGSVAAASQSQELLVALGVPPERIDKIGGRNTREELSEFAEWLDNNPQASRDSIGIVTSAWHMNRALRLAESFGIRARPVPADFRTLRPRESPHLLIPGATNLQFCESCLAEYLAGFFQR